MSGTNQKIKLGVDPFNSSDQS